MPISLTDAQINRYLTDKDKHPTYDQTVKEHMDLKIHIEGDYPKEIIDKARPHEPEFIKSYRKDIFAAVTMTPTNKVITTLNKIRKSQDWLIKFDNEKIPATVPKDNTLQQYTETQIPSYGSLEKWAFDVLLKEDLSDSNGVCMVCHNLLEEVPSNEPVSPVPTIFNSHQVYGFSSGNFAILLSTETCKYKMGETEYTDGKVFFYVDTMTVKRYHQSSTMPTFTLVKQYEHNYGKMPAWKLGGMTKSTTAGEPFYRSRIYTMVPYLKEAVREYSDLQAGVVQHLYLERWEYEGPDCKKCKGTGYIKSIKTGENVACTAKGCNHGKVISSPFETLYMKRPSSTDPNPVIAPPAGFVDRDVSIIKLQDERVDKHIFKALSAVNMEFLAQTPMNISGEAKKTDREETNTFTGTVAEDLVANLDKCYEFINYFRYHILVKDKDKLADMLPAVNVPEKFDMFTSEYLAQEMKLAIDAGVGFTTIVAMQKEYAGKKFNADPSVKKEAELVLDLDPFAGLTDDQKMTRLSNGGIAEINYIISSNIGLFVKEAMQEDVNFGEKKYADQMKVMNEKAQKVKDENDEAKKLLLELENPTLDPNAPPAQ